MLYNRLHRDCKTTFFFAFFEILQFFLSLQPIYKTNTKEMLKNYETVFIATPVLSEAQMKETAAKYISLIKENGGTVVSEEDWGLKKLAYPIQKKTSGFYHLVEFQAEPAFVEKLETQYRRDERIIRFLTFAMDKDAVAYAEKRRANWAAKKNAPAAEKKENQ